jgi:hypothetical protein
MTLRKVNGDKAFRGPLSASHKVYYVNYDDHRRGSPAHLHNMWEKRLESPGTLVPGAMQRTGPASRDKRRGQTAGSGLSWTCPGQSPRIQQAPGEIGRPGPGSSSRELLRAHGSCKPGGEGRPSRIRRLPGGKVGFELEKSCSELARARPSSRELVQGAGPGLRSPWGWKFGYARPGARGNMHLYANSNTPAGPGANLGIRLRIWIRAPAGGGRYE